MDTSNPYLDGMIAGIKLFAWWKDGVQYVGIDGTTLQSALEEVSRTTIGTPQVRSNSHGKLLEACKAAEIYLDERADCDQPSGSSPIPNEEMVLLMQLRAAIAAAEPKPKEDAH